MSGIKIIIERGKDFGLKLNLHKCELISYSPTLTVDPKMDKFTKVVIDESTLLGAPLTIGTAMDKTLTTWIEDLRQASKRLALISTQDALILLRALKLMYTLQSARCFTHPSLAGFNDELSECLPSITNINILNLQGKQASLPVN